MAPNKRKILEAARKYAQKGAKDRALKEYEKLLKLDPRDAKLRLEIGDAYRRWGQVDEAITAYTKVAEQYTDEGFDARAVAVYKQIQNLDPNCHAAHVRLAELYQRMGLTSEAIQALQTAADGYHREGKKREALELLRKMATLDPTNTTSRIKVADLLRQEDLLDEAIAEYEEAHAELVRQGDSETAAHVLERILEIEPKRVPTLSALANNLLKRGFAERAEPFAKRAVEGDSDEVAHYELLADVYRAQQRDAELAQTYRSLAEIYRRRGDEEKARDIIQRFVPPDGFAAPLGADAGLGGEPLLGGDALIDDDSLIGGASLLDGRSVLGEPAAEEPTLIQEDLLEEDLLDARGPDGDMELQDLAEPTLVEFSNASAAAPPTKEIPIPRQLDEELEPPAPEVTGDPEQLLAEASVYLRYGKRAQAVENLEKILAANREHRGALEKLGEAHAAAGDSAAAVAAWLRAAESARRGGDEDGLLVLRDRIAALDAAAAASLGARAAGPEPDVEEMLEISAEGDELALESEPPEMQAPPGHEPEIEFTDEIEIDVGEIHADEANQTDTDTDIEIGPPSEAAEDKAPPRSGEANASASMSQQLEEDLEEAEFYRQQGLLDEAAAIYERVLQLAPNHPLAQVRMGEIAAERGEDPGATGTGLTPLPEASEPQQEAEEATPAVDIGQDLAEWSDAGLDDTGVDQLEAAVGGRVEESREFEVPIEADAASDESAADMGLDADFEVDIPIDDETDSDLLAADTSDASVLAEASPEAADDVAEANAEGDTEEVMAVDAGLAAAAEDAPGVDDDTTEDAMVVDEAAAASFDLAAELSEVLDADEGMSSGNLGAGVEDDGFAAVFREFKKGVSQALSEADHETHYDLGIAYREMGLLDDAINEFQLAMGSASRRVDSLHMLGICSHELERSEEAVVHLQRALGTEGVTDAQVMAIRFELGLALESIGEIDRAREAWERVAAVDPTFCEVEKRLAALADAKPDPEPETDRGFESFNDLFEAEEEAGDTASKPAEAQESFEDLIAEANQAAEENDDTGFPGPGDTASAGQGPEETGELEAPQPRAEPQRRSRKKKISFV